MKLFIGLLACAVSFVMLSCDHFKYLTGNYIKWCDGDGVYTCEKETESDVVGYVELVDQCDPGRCREYPTPSGEITAGCLATLNPCPEGIDSICVGDVLATCNIEREAIAGKYCAQTQDLSTKYCMVSPVDNNGYCTYFNETCTPENAEKYLFLNYNAVCQKGLWTGRRDTSVSDDTNPFPDDSDMNQSPDD